MNEATENQSLLAQLSAAGAMATSELTSQTVKVGAGEATVYVRELSDKQFRKILTRVGGYDRAELIAAVIADDQGKPVFTVEQAGDLKPQMARELEELAMKCNGFDSKKSEEAGNA